MHQANILRNSNSSFTHFHKKLGRKVKVVVLHLYCCSFVLLISFSYVTSLSIFEAGMKLSKLDP